MADPSPPGGLWDRAGHVFALADQLGRAFHDEQARRSQSGSTEPAGWDRHQPVFDALCAAVLALRDPMLAPPDGFSPVAAELRDAARVAKRIRDAMQRPDGRACAVYLGFSADLCPVAAAGMRAVRATAAAAPRPDDPFAFVDAPAAGNGIDTTPTVAMPPARIVAAAARGIPTVLADVRPTQVGAVEQVADHLTKKLQDAGHSPAAAQWAIHEAVRVGRLRAERVVIELPSTGYPNPDPLGPATVWVGGQRGTRAIPAGKPAPFDCFKVVATDALWAWWRSLDSAEPHDAGGGARGLVRPEDGGDCPDKPGADPAQPRRKRSTERGDGRAKLIAALTRHHQYAGGGCLKLEAVGNNELACQAGVAKRTASAFFTDKFGGHAKYRAICRDTGKLVVALKLLNDEFSPHDLYGRRPAAEGS